MRSMLAVAAVGLLAGCIPSAYDVGGVLNLRPGSRSVNVNVDVDLDDAAMRAADRAVSDAGRSVERGVSANVGRAMFPNLGIMDPEAAWAKLVSEAGIAFDPVFVSATIENEDGDDATMKDFLTGMRIAIDLTKGFRFGKWTRDAAGRTYEVEIVTDENVGVMVFSLIGKGRARVGARDPESGTVLWSTAQIEAMGIMPAGQR